MGLILPKSRSNHKLHVFHTAFGFDFAEKDFVFGTDLNKPGADIFKQEFAVGVGFRIKLGLTFTLLKLLFYCFALLLPILMSSFRKSAAILSSASKTLPSRQV